MCNEIDKVLRALFNHYSLEVGVVNENNATSSQPFGEETVLDVDDDPTTYLSYEYKRLLEETSSGTGKLFSFDFIFCVIVLMFFSSIEFVIYYL